MTPTDPAQQQPSPPPAALPLISLILGVIGLCIPCFFPVGLTLAIVSLVKSSAPAYAARKTLAIIALVLSVVAIPIWGILAAIAIPNFIKFQARSKQSECKTQLRTAYMMQQSFWEEHETFADAAADLDFSVDGVSRYSYRFGPDSVVAPSESKMSVQQLEAAYPRELTEILGITGECPDNCAVTMACAGNIDNDDTVDVWVISSQEQEIDGRSIPAGTPYNLRDDVTE